MRIKVNRYCIAIFMLIMFDLNMFYMVDKYRYTFIGIGFYDIVFVIKILIFIWTLLKYHKCIFSKKYSSKIIYFAFFLIIISGIAGTFTYKQPFYMGILAQREWLSSLLMYFPIKIWLNVKKITEEQLKNSLYVTCGIYLILCIAQYLLSSYIIFMKLREIGERYGEVRMRFELVFIVLLLGFVIDDILQKKRKKVQIYAVLLLAASIILIVVVTKGRMAMISCIGSIVICLALRKTSVIKKVIIILCVLIGVVFFMSTTIGQDVMNVLWGSGTGLSPDTLTIRDKERLYYMGLLFENPWSLFTGYGYPSATFENALNISVPTIGYWTYYTSDIGVMGNMFYYGIIGLLWWLTVVIYSFVKSYKIYKKTSRTAFLQVMGIEIIGSFTLIPFIFNTTVAFPLYLVWMEHAYNEGKVVH